MKEIRPALTPEEWAEWRKSIARARAKGWWGVPDWDDIGPFGDEAHKTAAIALDELGPEKGGFTRDDVEILRNLAATGRSAYRHADMDASREVYEELDSLADRIDALLPPRNP